MCKIMRHLLNRRDYTYKIEFTKPRSNTFHIDGIMRSALYAIARPSVCLSHRWINQKLLKFNYSSFCELSFIHPIQFKAEEPKMRRQNKFLAYKVPKLNERSVY